MDVLSSTINQMLVLFSFMALGYFLNFKGILPLNTSTAISRLETYVLVPCLVFSTFYKYCTVKNMREKWQFILYGAVIVIVSLGIAFLLSKVFAKEKYLRNIYSYCFTVANFGFMGNAVVLGMFGDKVLFDYMIFTMPFNIYVYSLGIALLIPQKDSSKKRFSLKRFINPVFITMFLGAVAGLTKVWLPKFLLTAVSQAGACMSPLAMILTGFVVANYSFKTLTGNIKIYITSIIRLIILPLIFVLVLKLMNTDSTIITLTLCATAMPLGLNTVVFPATFGGDTTPGASMALISNIMALVTIPIMFAIFI